MELQVGHNIKGYELQERIGTGGFGAVYRAYQSTVGREVAIKVILPGHANQPDFIRRFATEAQLIAQLEHHHIIPLYDYWRDPEGAYLVMRYLRGGSLLDVLHTQGALSVEEAGMMLDQIAQALHTAHRSNIIHRDIKPTNILLDEDGNAFLADFGIAKDYSRKVDVTDPDVIVGSPDYLAPEQARSEPSTPQTDIYSLGVVLYEILEGQHPFPNLNPIERLYKHLNESLPDLSKIDESICEGINNVIQKATAKDPTKRFKDVIEMFQAFQEVATLNHNSVTMNIVELLTPREQEVLKLIIDGRRNREIAEKLVLTIATVKTYVRRIYKKLNVRSRVQAIVKARELDLIVESQSAVMTTNTGNLPEPDNPYKGLQAFRAADEQEFFGREKLTQKLLKRLEENVLYQRFLAVVGPSGSGKSSVVKAGLIPAIWRGEIKGSDKWYIVEMIPGNHPLEELEVALLRVAGNPSINLSEQLAHDTRGLLRSVNLILPEDDSELVLVIDQFEEVFTLIEDEAHRKHFLSLLYVAITDEQSRVRVVVTYRADYYDRPLHYPLFADLMRSRIETVLPLSADELEQAIRQPATQVGVTFEQGLLSQIISDVNYQPGALPLLQYALTELFERREGLSLKQTAYQAIGGTGGALAKRADEIYLEHDEAGQELIRQMFLRLVTLGEEGAEDTRRRIMRSELLDVAFDEETMDDVIDAYSTSRFLALDHDPASRRPTVEVAHEAILSQWERLREWINTNREEIKMQQQLSRMTEEWMRAKQDPSYLATGLRLEQIVSWAESSDIALTDNERQFLLVSIDELNQRKQVEQARKAREATLERRSVQRLRWLVTVFAVATILSISLSIFAFDRENQAQNARATSDANVAIAQQRADENQSLRLIDAAQQQSVDNPQLALALALEANRIDNPPLQAQRVLREQAENLRMVRQLIGHTGGVRSIGFSPDGKTALSGSTDDTLILWDLATGTVIHRFEGHTSTVLDVAFSPDGLTALSGSHDDTLILWNLTTGTLIRRFQGHSDGVNSVAFSPDGLTVLSGSNDDTLILWDVNTGNVIRIFNGHSSNVRQVAFSPDSRTIISSDSSNLTIQWDVSTGEQIYTFDGGENAIAFRPNGNRVFTGDNSGQLAMWNLLNSELVSELQLHDGHVNTLAIYEDITIGITSGYPNQQVMIWDSITGELQRQLVGYANSPITSVTLSPDGDWVITGTNDGALILWDLRESIGELHWITGLSDSLWGGTFSPDGRTILLAGGTRDPNQGLGNPRQGEAGDLLLLNPETGDIIHRFEGHSATVTKAVFSPDGATILSGSQDSTLILWDVVTGQLIRRFQGHSDMVWSVAFSPDASHILSGSFDNTMILWEAETGNIIQRFEGHNDAVVSVAFAPDGQTILSGSKNSTLILWDVESGQVIQPLEGHSYCCWVEHAVFSPDGSAIVSSSGSGKIILWDVVSKQPIRYLEGHADIVLNATFSPDGQSILSASADGTLILWDVVSGRSIKQFEGHTDWVRQATFSPDGRTAVSVSTDGTARVWAISTDLMIEWVEDNRYIHDFTCEEREQYRIEPLCDISTSD